MVALPASWPLVDLKRSQVALEQRTLLVFIYL